MKTTMKNFALTLCLIFVCSISYADGGGNNDRGSSVKNETRSCGVETCRVNNNRTDTIVCVGVQGGTKVGTFGVEGSVQNCTTVSNPDPDKSSSDYWKKLEEENPNQYWGKR